MIVDNHNKWEDSCKVGRPGEVPRNWESTAQIARVETFVAAKDTS